MTEIEQIKRYYNAAIDFAVERLFADEAHRFLTLWREGRWPEIALEFPEFDGPLPN